MLLRTGVITAARPGSNSQRNAERKDFQIAYTRTKCQLFKSFEQTEKS